MRQYNLNKVVWGTWDIADGGYYKHWNIFYAVFDSFCKAAAPVKHLVIRSLR